MRKKHEKARNTLLDVAILTAGGIDPKIFEKCVQAVCTETAEIPSKLYAFRNGVPEETKVAYDNILGCKDIRVDKSPQNKGYPYGANRVIRAGNSPLVLFVSDDVILHEGTVEKLIRRMDDPTIGICGLKLIFPIDSTDPGRPAGKVQHIGHAIDIHGEVVHPLLGWNPDNPKCNISREAISVTGACFIVRRGVFNKAGGFFEGYGMGYFEDVDLNLEIRQQGHKVFIDTEATATHHVGETFISQKIKAPFEQNKMILRQRKGSLFFNDSWTYW